MTGRRIFRMLGKVVAYQRGYARVTGSVTAGLYLSQLVYLWTTADDFDEEVGGEWEGWLSVTMQAMFDATELSRYQQERARRRLSELGVLEERFVGSPPKIEVKLNLETLFDLLKVAVDAPVDPTMLVRHNVADSILRVPRKLDPPQCSGLHLERNSQDLLIEEGCIQLEAVCGQEPAAPPGGQFEMEEVLMEVVPEPEPHWKVATSLVDRMNGLASRKFVVTDHLKTRVRNLLRRKGVTPEGLMRMVEYHHQLTAGSKNEQYFNPNALLSVDGYGMHYQRAQDWHEEGRPGLGRPAQRAAVYGGKPPEVRDDTWQAELTKWRVEQVGITGVQLSQAEVAKKINELQSKAKEVVK